MKSSLIIISIVAVLYCCGVSNKPFIDEIKKIKVTYKSPEEIIDGKGVSFLTSFNINYYKQYIVVELSYHVTSEINNKLIYDSIKYEYFVCNPVNKFGYLLKNISDSFKVKINGDSILRTRAYNGVGMDSVKFSDVGGVKSIQKLHTSSGLIHKYLFNNDNFYDSAYFYYDEKLKWVPFSADKVLDSMNNSKLFKLEFFIKHDTAGVTPNLKDFFINSLEISEEQVTNKNGLKILFERFISDEKK
jgi:hypothetical protein